MLKAILAAHNAAGVPIDGMSYSPNPAPTMKAGTATSTANAHHARRMCGSIGPPLFAHARRNNTVQTAEPASMAMSMDSVPAWFKPALNQIV